MKPVFGIHVGNSTACLAIHKQDDSRDFVQVVSNNAGDRVMPAIVTATEDEYVVGAACKSLMISRWNTTVTCFKLTMDKEVPETSNNSGRKAKTLVKDGELCYELPLETGVEYKTPADIASCMYSSLYEIAKSAVPGVYDISCVLMVPKHFSKAVRYKVQTAAEAAGWDVIQIINEPAAVVLGYNIISDKTPQSPQTVLVYRVGGQSCDASVLDLNFGMVSVLATESSEDVGGKLLSHTLTNYLADEFYRKYKLNPRENHRSLTKLTLAADNCLHVLSTIESSKCFVESLCDGVDFSYIMSRARFESLLFPFLPTFVEPIHKVLSRLGLSTNNVSTILLCGGLLKIPRLNKYICDMFEESSAKVVALPNGINYDEVLACGAARQAGYIAVDKIRDTFIPNEMDIPVLQSAVNVQVEGAQCEGTEFPAGQPLPAFRTLMITSLNKQVKITFVQTLNPEVFLKGEIELSKNDLEGDDHLSLTIDSDFQISVAVPEVSGSTVTHLVKMFASPSIIC